MKRYKKYLAYLVVGLTFAVFIWYVNAHPKVIEQLKNTSLPTVLGVLGLYAAMTAVLVEIFDLTLKLCGVTISGQDNTLLTLYSSVVNFFGPLQSGPGFRMVYLKKRFGVRMASYLGASLIYYAIFGLVSGLFLLSGLIGVWGCLGLILLWLLLAKIIAPWILRFPRIAKVMPPAVSLRLLSYLALVTVAQLLLVAVIYFVELKSLQPGIGFNQALVYAGAANFSLFVSLTPGALGFRESFIFFAQRLHHIDSVTIVTANILDRGLYVAFLGLVFLGLLGFHGRQKLQSFKAPK
jgi:uncharacterized membrane protein YbhN (UPF0104 family)